MTGGHPGRARGQEERQDRRHRSLCCLSWAFLEAPEGAEARSPVAGGAGCSAGESSSSPTTKQGPLSIQLGQLSWGGHLAAFHGHQPARIPAHTAPGACRGSPQDSAIPPNYTHRHGPGTHPDLPLTQTWARAHTHSWAKMHRVLLCTGPCTHTHLCTPWQCTQVHMPWHTAVHIQLGTAHTCVYTCPGKHNCAYTPVYTPWHTLIPVHTHTWTHRS